MQAPGCRDYGDLEDTKLTKRPLTTLRQKYETLPWSSYLHVANSKKHGRAHSCLLVEPALTRTQVTIQGSPPRTNCASARLRSRSPEIKQTIFSETVLNETNLDLKVVLRSNATALRPCIPNLLKACREPKIPCSKLHDFQIPLR